MTERVEYVISFEVDKKCADSYKHWPKLRRTACLAYVGRILRDHPGYSVVDDQSHCMRRPDGRWSLERRLVLQGP